MVSNRTKPEPIDLQVCTVFHGAIELIGRRWTGAIVSVMLKGATRFCEIREAIPGISDRLLTERLKELEDNEIIAREVTSERPLQVTYHLTEKGRALGPVLDSVTDWAGAWSGGHGAE
ncbi:MAG: winged helix-turn-helix transcriptional regulator [Coriobacteriia bacterium]|nr:winged helix-turn-helix transcriptional regulator [Coriobacteriia bacterium]